MYNTNFSVPEPLDFKTPLGRELYPWRSFMEKYVITFKVQCNIKFECGVPHSTVLGPVVSLWPILSPLSPLGVWCVPRLCSSTYAALPNSASFAALWCCRAYLSKSLLPKDLCALSCPWSLSPVKLISVNGSHIKLSSHAPTSEVLC